MKNMFYFIVCLLMVISTNSYAQNQDKEDVKLKIEEMTLMEQNAFKNGDCKTVMDLMDDDITFFANGRPSPPKAMIEKFCKSVSRPFKKLHNEKMDIYVLSSDSGYVVRQLDFDKDEKISVKEIVTKIWKRTEKGWKIVHLQSTVKETPKSK